MIGVIALLRSLNTHFVSNAGIFLTVAGALADPSVSNAIVGMLPPHYASLASHTIVAIGAVALYLGKPRTVPASPVAALAAAPLPVALVAELLHAPFEGVSTVSQPAFIVKAEAIALDRVIALAEDPANKTAVLAFVQKEVAAGGLALVPLADTVVNSLASKNALVRMFSGEAKAEVASLESSLVAEVGSVEEVEYAKALVALHALRDFIGK